jgi:hypothetical protein
VEGRQWSDGLQKLAVWLSGLVTFAEAESVLAKVGQIPLSDSSAWRQVQDWGERGRVLEVQQRTAASALPARSQIAPGEPTGAQVKGIALDGAMLHIRGEGYKELKVGDVFEVALQPSRDRKTGEVVELAHAVHSSYVAYLGGPEVFGQLLWAEARRRGWTQARETVALGDGAAWIWNLVAEHFYDSRQVVDWYHASSHLRLAAALLHGEGTPQAQQWFKAHDTLLYEGHADRIATILRDQAKSKRKMATDLRREAGYFDDNYRRMQYLETREDDLPIGSGPVESACKQYRARLAGPGMRWSRPGAERMLPIRTAILSHAFDAWWQHASAMPLN